MPEAEKDGGNLFDEWPDQYDRWFKTPIGMLVKQYETQLVLEFLNPQKGELILDAGCGSGVFTRDILSSGAYVTGMDVSKPMLKWAMNRLDGRRFKGILGDMRSLPFADGTFDKTVSITAIEFISRGKNAIDELFRVTKPGGVIVVTTLNSLSPWARRRKQAAKTGHSLFQNVVFRSPEDLLQLGGKNGKVKTAIHFLKDDEPKDAVGIEEKGRRQNLMTGAFLAVRWIKHPEVKPGVR